jgi:hypothetical protein
MPEVRNSDLPAPRTPTAGNASDTPDTPSTPPDTPSTTDAACGAPGTPGTVGGTPDTSAAAPSIRWEPWLGAIPAIAGVLLTIAGLRLGMLLVFGLLAAAVLSLTFMIVRPAWGGLRYALAAAPALVLVAFAVTVMYYQGHPRTKTVTKVERPVSLARSASHLKFLPVNGAVSHCVDFSGTGRIPDGDALVIFDRPTDPGGRYTPTSTFSFDGEATPSPTGWTVPELNLGSGDASDKGQHMAILAVLMPENIAGFLDALNRDSETGAVPTEAPKLGENADQLVVVRNGHNAHC